MFEATFLDLGLWHFSSFASFGYVLAHEPAHPIVPFGPFGHRAEIAEITIQRLHGCLASLQTACVRIRCVALTSRSSIWPCACRFDADSAWSSASAVDRAASVRSALFLHLRNISGEIPRLCAIEATALVSDE